MSLKSDDEIIASFNHHDRNNDGFISISELESLFLELSLPISKRDLYEYYKYYKNKSKELTSIFS
jgi:Ca2+-binding EF-hand superfamily protein